MFAQERMRVALLQPVVQFTRKDGDPGIRRDIKVSDASQRCVQVTLYMKIGEALSLARGQYVALCGTLKLWQNQLSLNVSGTDVMTEGLSEGVALAEQFRRAPWVPTPADPHWRFVGFDVLPDQPDGGLVDVIGVLVAIEVHGGRFLFAFDMPIQPTLLC